MKRLVFLISFITISLFSAAQVSFGVQGGGNVGFVHTEDDFFFGFDDDDVTTDPKVGFLAGAVVNIPFAGKFSFRPELNYIQTSFKRSTDNPGFYISEEHITANFIELPLNIVFNLPAGRGAFMFGAGPRLAMGISGRNEWYSTQAGEPEERGIRDLKFDGKRNFDVYGNDNDPTVDHYKAFDLGMNLLIGYKFQNGMFFNLGFTQGVLDLSTDNNSNFITSGLTFKLGYTFGGK